MDRNDLLALLDQLKAGTTSHEAAVRRVEHATFEDLGFAKLDHQRQRRTGVAEVVYAQGKSDAQLLEICRGLTASHPRLLVTRLEPERQQRLAADLPPGHYNATARTLSVGLAHAKSLGRVCIVCAGTADLPVAQEALETARLLDCRVDLVADVGVAGLHRLLGALERIRQARVVVVCAGMEGALPSVVGGLVRAPVIAVPTSVGYGASLGGVTALLAMMNSCAAGVTVVNIDNGFGAGYAAALINTLPPAE
ncbi:MAG TPA: nickel pincer cofactor biosynthesis protein LarB [bacterium]|nr:nickel pincer cofactor biosynthesis protein LarB [bacterium]